MEKKMSDTNLETLNKLRDNATFISKFYLNPYSFADPTEYLSTNLLFSAFLMMMLKENNVNEADLHERFNEINIYFRELKDKKII
jgi:hypothetical protein